MHGIGSLLNVITVPPGAGTGQRIVVDGLRGAIFEYSAANQLVGSWASKAGTDPYGNAYPAGFSLSPASGSVISGAMIIVEGADGEILVYSGNAAPGNLIASISAVSSTDIHGNAYLAGVASYQGAGAQWFASVMHGGGQFLYSATTYAGPWTQEYSLIFDFTSNGPVLTPAGINSTLYIQGFLNILNALVVQGNMTVDGGIRSSGGTPALPSQFSTDAPNSLGSLGATGITINEATYYMMPVGPFGANMVFISIKGMTSGSGPTAGSTAFPNAMPAAYRPVNTTPVPVGNGSASASWWVNVGTGGIVTLHYPTAAAGINFSCQALIDLQ